LSSLLRGTFRVDSVENNYFRKASVVLQFIVAQIVIMVSIFIFKQMNFINNKDLGYDSENIICAGLPESPGSTLATLSNQLLSVPGVTGVSFSSVPPARAQQWTSVTLVRNNEQEKLDAEIKFIDTAYLNLYNFRIIAGKNFSSTDSTAVIVNKEFIFESGFANAEESIGKVIDGPGVRCYIVGVVDDFNSGSLHDGIRPCLFFVNPGGFRSVNIKVASSGGGIIDRIQENWRIIFPEENFQYQFLDDAIDSYYKSERKTFNLLILFSGVTIFLCILGVLGLSLSMNHKRIKEIGLRRVNGATIQQILYLLNRDFMNWILIAFIISVPVSWYFVFRWLQNFAFKTSISWWVFILAGLIVTGISLFVLSVQSYNAAASNPVESLRNE
jgi:ABC-type antimicrobial peptide transport system permease subunit